MCGRRRSPTSSGRRAWRPAPARTWTCTTRRTKKAVLASRDAGAALRAAREVKLGGTRCTTPPRRRGGAESRRAEAAVLLARLPSGSRRVLLHCTPSQPAAAVASNSAKGARWGGAPGGPATARWRWRRRWGWRPGARAGASSSSRAPSRCARRLTRPPPPLPSPLSPRGGGGRWRGASRWPAPAGGGPCVTWHRQVAAARVRPSLPGVSVPRRPQPDEPLRRPSPPARAGGRPGPRLGAPAGPGLTPCGRRRRGPPRSRGSTRWTVSAGETGGSGRPPPTSSPSPSPPPPASPAAG